ncbi:MAG: response regulator [Proteobacteria bacterium]|nr:response regulator [Pseudomonadota bacterium]MBU1714388.1 response regulator [Pseudomonadota bacterium]
MDKKINILVVDDSTVMRMIIVKHLKIMGFENIVQAPDGVAALEIIQQGGIDLILSDWCMPLMYGIDLLKAVRADDAMSRIPFIMISAEAQDHLINMARAEGVSYYIIKPFTQAVLHAGVAHVLCRPPADSP